jgi:hypothetical protein
MSSSKSLAVWCAPRVNSTSSAIDAHFNYWRIAGDEEFARTAKKEAKKEVNDFLEIGVMLDDPHQIERVYIYLPQLIADVAITDCSDYFAEPNLAQGIFNEVLAVGWAAPPGPREVELRKGADMFCRVHKFMTVDEQLDPADLDVTPFADGTLLTITRQALDEACIRKSPPAPTYFRIRVNQGKSDDTPFITRIPAPDRLFQSGFDEIEYIDFRLNDARTLPAQVEARMRGDQAGMAIKLRLVAFLTAVPVLSALSVSNTQFHKLRLLEHQVWNGYVPTGIPTGMMVYHWKQSSPAGITDFSAFVKLQTRRSGRWTLFRYLGIAFLFGLLGNLVASVVEALFERR